MRIRGPGFYFFLFISVIQSVLAAHVPYVISGAGPAGLTAALELLDAGANPEDVLVVEARSFEKYATRPRAILLEDQSVEQLARLRVNVPGSTFKKFRFIHKENEYIFYNNGVMKDSLLKAVLSRRVNKIVLIGELEKSLLKEYQRRGGRISFGTTLSEEISYKYLFVAEGTRSKTREKLGIRFDEIYPERAPYYIGTDYVLDHSEEEAKGTLYFDKDGKWVGYEAAGGNGGSIGVWTETPVDLEDPDIKEKHRARIEKILADSGTYPDSFQDPYLFNGKLYQANKIRIGNVFLIGDALRASNPEAGNGLNTALKDASAVGSFYTVHRYSEKLAEYKLENTLRQNSHMTLNRSVQFRNLVEWIANRPTGAEKALQFGHTIGSFEDEKNKFRALEYVPSFLLLKAMRLALKKAGVPLLEKDAKDSINLSDIHADCGQLLKR